MNFDQVIVVDWSGGNDRGAKPTKDAIWACVARAGITDKPIYFRNRQAFEIWITQNLDTAIAAGERVFCGFDFPFGYPRGFAEHITGQSDPFALWNWLEQAITDEPRTNNRFEVAATLNRKCEGVGPFWGNGTKTDWPDLPRKGTHRRDHGFAEKRAAETATKGAFTVWQLAGAGSVGSQTLMGLPVLQRLRKRFERDVSVWPIETPKARIVLAEVWPSLISDVIERTMPQAVIKDAHQVETMSRAISRLPKTELSQMMNIDQTTEGWIFGLGHEDTLKRSAASDLTPPPLRNDCFAMPQGAYWTPEEDALQHLKCVLTTVVAFESCIVPEAAGRVLSADVLAERSHPPTPNSAVDGYALVGPIPGGAYQFPVIDGISAAGHPYAGVVEPGAALRILTGAAMPEGADTVILQEDVTTDGQSIAFHGPLKAGANARKAGEDMTAGAVILPKGRRLTPADLGTLTAAGVAQVDVYMRLRVGVLSTGDELREAGEPCDPAHIYDANRPMLLANLRAWGFDAVDLGRAPDDRAVLRKMLDDAANKCDAILTSGGASAGDEDHMSALLNDTGDFALWRIAIKPGRPLALGMWNKTPVFGLPGNPVAAQVCSLIFAYPAFCQMSGQGWPQVDRFPLPAGFSKTKKDGRTEYLRARIEDGRAVPFPSEGSGRISGLSWATGLIRLPHAAAEIKDGDPVEFIPFASFGL